MSINPTQAPDTSLPIDQISVGDQNLGTSGTNGNSHYIPLDECQCTICTEYFINAVETNCRHRFCNFCIHRWFHANGRRQCPTCRCNVTHLNPLPSLDSSIQRMILSLSGDQIQERERIRNRRHHTDHRYRGRNGIRTHSRVNGTAFLPTATDESTNAPVLTVPSPRPTNTNGNLPPGNNTVPNPEPPDPSGGTSIANRISPETSSNNRRYIDEMTDTMNDYEYHLTRAQAAHRRMVQARSDYEIQENRLHTLFNRFVTLSAAAEASYESERQTMNLSGNDGFLDSELDEFSMTPNSRPSTLGLGAMINQRFSSDNYPSFDTPRPTRGQLRSPWGLTPTTNLVTSPPYMPPSRIDISVATNERLDPFERVSRLGRIIPTPNFRETNFAATPLTSNSRRPNLNDVISLRNDITRNANLTRASYDRHVSLRQAMSINRRRLDQLRDERNRFQVQVDRLEAQTVGTTGTSNSTILRENDTITNRENGNINNRESRMPARFTMARELDIPRSLANTNADSNRLTDEVNEMWEQFRSRILQGQPQGEDSDSEDAEQPTRDNDVDDLATGNPNPQEDPDAESDPELRIEFRTPTMTLKMTNFSQK